MNYPLFIFDIILLPITLIRLLLIFLYGSRYDIKNFEFLDIMMHASNKYYNQKENTIFVDTINDDIRLKLNYCSRYVKDNIPELNNKYAIVNKDIMSNTSINTQIINNPEQTQKNNIPVVSPNIPNNLYKLNNSDVDINFIGNDRIDVIDEHNNQLKDIDVQNKDKLLDLIDHHLSDTTNNKLRSDINKINLKLKKVNEILENNTDMKTDFE